MLIGIDLRGTFTDGILCSEGVILKTTEAPDKGVMTCRILFLVALLDELLQGVRGSAIGMLCSAPRWLQTFWLPAAEIRRR